MKQKNIFGQVVSSSPSSNSNLEGGYELYDVLSAIQKDIRRGNKKGAGWWAYILLKSNQIYMFWRRMYVIAAEDCDYQGVKLVDACKRGFDWVTNYGKNINGDGLLFGVKAAIGLAEMKKDRTADDYVCYFEDLVKQKNFAKGEQLPKIPDYAYDGHTIKGKKMGRGFNRPEGHLHFWIESCKLNPISENYDDSLKQKYIEYFEKKIKEG